MKANELRIGNWVTVNNKKWWPELKGRPVIVAGIKLIFKTDFTESNASITIIDKEQDEYSQYNQFIEPIPLTPEIFVLNGCGEDNNGHFLLDLQTHYLEIIPSKAGFYPVYGQKMEMSGDNDNRVSLNRINYVHQYQNLYFTLTGEELNIDL